MLRLAALVSFVVSALASVLATQVPFNFDQRWHDNHNPLHSSPEDIEEWSFHKPPSPNATDHLVFETVHSLLQHWPNTRMRNGHTIVPGIITEGTLLYHGTPRKELPTGPEWIAVDPEHSYLFCRNMLDSSQRGGWHLTLMATRPLKIVYFDGNSAAKFSYGSMDTQDLITWGKPSGNDDILKEETERIQYLCKWGKKFGVDGIVRMQMDFEIMLCDFTSGVSVVSFDHVASQWSGSSMFSTYEWFEVFNAGSWHNRFPGEMRILLDLAGLVSFYDTQIAPSLVPIRAGQERWDHRAINISSQDLVAVKSRLEANLIRPGNTSSKIDWKTLFQIIVDRYAGRLELTRYLLNSSASGPAEILDLATKAQTQLRVMLTPYILFSVAPTSQSDTTELDWAIPIYKHCSMTHTHMIESRFGYLTDSEKLLVQAVRGTSREICRVVTKMWAAGVYAGIDPLLNAKESHDTDEIARVRDAWVGDLDELMKWLDWSIWIQCSPSCGPEETCYLPTWPMGFPWFSSQPLPAPLPIDDDFVSHPGLNHFTSQAMTTGSHTNEVHNFKPEPDEWIRPKPKCIRRIYPYTF